jgi:hypothetical protein
MNGESEFLRFHADTTAVTVYKSEATNVNKCAAIPEPFGVASRLAGPEEEAIFVCLQRTETGVPLLFRLSGKLWYSGFLSDPAEVDTK